jgi:two-component system sensor histidine kinase/response regulator
VSMQLSTTERASVLVVDDNPLVLGVMRTLLAAHDYAVLTSENGKQALATLAEHSVDLIICDVMMPEMGGYDLHKAVRENRKLSHVPFVFLTALADPGEIEQGLRSGADDYLVKPFDPQKMLSIVEGKIARSRMLRRASADQFDDYRKRVVHTLSHEFRTPLVAINTGTELLIDNHSAMPVEKVQHLLEAIQRGGQRLERLVSDFMLLQQVEAGVSQRLFESRSTVLVVGEVVARVVEGLGEQIASLGYELSYRDETARARCKIYEPQFHEILARLVDNAVKFSPEHRRIDVVGRLVDSAVWVDVCDRGIGIDPQALDEAGNPFGQMNRDKLEQQGGGFGLAIAKRFAGVNRGRIEIGPREGGGTVVSVIIPVYDPLHER